MSDVVARLGAIVDPLPETDGVACFAHLYLEVTRAVQDDLRGRAFSDPSFLAGLDIAFADLFFAALDAYERDPNGAPKAWVPLLEARSARGIAPLQFALAGMNAHINRDLPVALTQAWIDSELEPSDWEPEGLPAKPVPLPTAPSTA